MARQGGRQKGTPNKKTQEIVELLEEKFPGYNPIVAMAEIANDPSVELSIRTAMHKEVAQYIAPKRKAVDVTSQGDKVQFGFTMNVKGKK